MGNAAWLTAALPLWFARLFWAPPSELILVSLVIWLALFAAVGGISSTIEQRDPRPAAIFISVGLSFVMVAFAGFFRGQVKGDAVLWILAGMTVVQLLVIAGVVYRAGGARAAAALMAPLCFCFWLFAGFVSAMSLSDSWL